MTRSYNVAILGATGAVGNRIIEQLKQATIPVNHVKLLASSRSAGKQLMVGNTPVTVEEATPDSFAGVDLVLASAGGAVSKALLPAAVKQGQFVWIIQVPFGWLPWFRWLFRRLTGRA